MQKRLIAFLWLPALILLLSSAPAALCQALQITSPAGNILTSPGQTISVTVAASAGTFTQVFLAAENPINFSNIVTAAPFQFSVTIPTLAPIGVYHFTAVGNAGTGSLILSQPIVVYVERSDTPTAIAVQPSQITFETQGQQVSPEIIATFSDGSTADLTGSTQLSYTSSNLPVATVSPSGTVTAIGTGSAVLSVAYARAVSAAIPVAVPTLTTTVSPPNLTFADTAVGSTSTQQTLTLTNSSSASLSSITVMVAGDFTETDNCTGQTIAAYGTCTIEVTYAPTTTGQEGGQVSVLNGVDVVPLSVPLSGTGISASAGTLVVSVTHAGTLSTGQTGEAYSISVQNAGKGVFSGTATVTEMLPPTLTLISLTGTGWTCTLSTATCTRGDTLAANVAYATITATVNVSTTAPASVSNTVLLTVTAGANTSMSSATDTAAIGPAIQTIAFAPLNNITMGTAAFSLIATTSSGLSPTYTSTTTSVCTVSGAAVTALAVGTCSITASRAGNASFPAAPSVTQSFTVSQVWQLIAFGPLSDQTWGTAPLALTATASSGLTPVTFMSNTPSVCTVMGNTVTILISGGCSITATQLGSTTYAPAAPVTQDFTVLFNDISPSVSYAAAVDLFAQYGITAGCGNDDFCANGLVTRAEMAVFIITGIFRGANFSYSPTPHFADVQPGTFGFKWIQAMYELGISGGCGGGNYCPNSSVTRDEMAVFIIVARFGGANFTYSSTPSFTDVPDSGLTANYFKFVQRMKQDGITAGCAKGVPPALPDYCPDEAVTRAQMAVFMMAGLFNFPLPAGAPAITAISPSTLAVGTSGTFTITGVNTTFMQGTTTLSPIPGVTIGTITVNSSTSLTVQLTAAANATPQPYTIVAITNSEQDVLPNSLTIQ